MIGILCLVAGVDMLWARPTTLFANDPPTNTYPPTRRRHAAGGAVVVDGVERSLRLQAPAHVRHIGLEPHNANKAYGVTSRPQAGLSATHTCEPCLGQDCTEEAGGEARGQVRGQEGRPKTEVERG